MKCYSTLAGLCGLSISAACASSTEYSGMSEEAAERLAEFNRTGELTPCLNVSRIRSITPLDRHYFLVRTGVGEYYLNKSSGCSNADRIGYRLQYNVYGSQLCRNQVITVVDNTSGIVSGSCGLGSFERLTDRTSE